LKEVSAERRGRKPRKIVVWGGEKLAYEEQKEEDSVW